MPGLNQLSLPVPVNAEERRHRDPPQLRSFVTKLQAQMAGAALLAAALVSYSVVASALTGAYTVPTVSSGSLLAGYGILATLVVAIQVLARGIGRVEKLENPTAAWMIHALASLVLFSSMALAVLGILGSFPGPIDMPRQFPPVDVVRLVGSIMFSALTGIPAAEARILTEALPEQQNDAREKALVQALLVKDSYPGKQPNKILVIFQWMALVVIAPVAASLTANLFWQGPPADAVMLGIVAAASEIAVFPLLRGAITALHSNRHLPLVGHASGCALLTAGPLALSLASVSHDGVKSAFALSTATFVPLLAVLMCSLPAQGSKWPRGIVLQSAVKSTERRIRSLEQASGTMREQEQRELTHRLAVIATCVLCLPLGMLWIIRTRGQVNRGAK